MEWRAVVTSWVTACLFSSVFCQKTVNPHNFNYIINNSGICGQAETIGLFIWVHSGPANYRRRIALRETWANIKNMPSVIGTTKLVFFLGGVRNSSLQSRVFYEADHYQDIIQEDYMDSYRNLTYKAMSGLKWISRYCKNIRMILKTDDDMMIDTKNLFTHLHAMTRYPEQPVLNTIMCDVWVDRKVERTQGMKWSVSTAEYPNSKYPTYCPGLALLMSPDLVSKLWEKAQETKYFWVDDVFFTGLLVETLNVTWLQLGSLFHFGGATLTNKFVSKPSDFIFGHVFSYRTDLFYYIWQSIFSDQNMIGERYLL